MDDSGLEKRPLTKETAAWLQGVGGGRGKYLKHY